MPECIYCGVGVSGRLCGNCGAPQPRPRTAAPKPALSRDEQADGCSAIGALLVLIGLAVSVLLFHGILGELVRLATELH
jgi:hypothetical protein